MFEEYLTMIMVFLPNLVSALLLFIVFYFVSKIATSLILKIGEKGNVGQRNVYKLLASTARMTLLAFGLLVALGTLGVDITPLIAGVGLSGLAISLALKDAVTNLLNGILILIYQPFKEGDIVKIAGSPGRVGEINLRYIQIINEEDGKEYLVPNSLAFAKVIEKSLKTDDK